MASSSCCLQSHLRAERLGGEAGVVDADGDGLAALDVAEDDSDGPVAGAPSTECR